VEIDIANILFICAGSFSDMEEASDTKPIGFFGDDAPQTKEVSTNDLVRYGFLPELLGRLPVRVQLDALTAEALVTVLTPPRDERRRTADRRRRARHAAPSCAERCRGRPPARAGQVVAEGSDRTSDRLRIEQSRTLRARATRRRHGFRRLRAGALGGRAAL